MSQKHTNSTCANLNSQSPPPRPDPPHPHPSCWPSPNSHLSGAGESDTRDCFLTSPSLTPHMEPSTTSSGFRLLSSPWVPLQPSSIPPWSPLTVRCLGSWCCLVHPAKPFPILKLDEVSNMQVFKSFFFGRTACAILVPGPGIEPRLPAVGAPSPNHRITREFP